MRRRMMMGQGGSKLPDGYIELEYVECSGAQYITLSFPSRTDISTLEIVANWLASSVSNNRTLYGSMDAWSGLSTYNYQIAALKNGYWYWGRSTNSASDNNVARVNISVTENTWYKSIQNESGVTLNGVSYSYNKSQDSPPLGSLLIGGYIDETTNTKNAQFRGYLGEFRLDFNTGAFWLKPAQNTNNEVGFYDLANDTFITSESGTAFVAGPVK